MSMLLIDAGNTRIKWVVLGDQPAPAWIARGDVATADASRLGDVTTRWRELDLRHALYCSVAGDVVNQVIESSIRSSGVATVRRFISQPVVGPLRNAYAQPTQLGADRLAAALGAWMRVRDDVVVVNAGTATTIDISRKTGDAAATGVFCGGVILPGLSLMRQSLSQRTAGLPLAKGVWHSCPNNTDDAIETGCLDAQCGAIERMRRRLAPGAPCILAGGAADALAPQIDAPLICAPDLVLEGLAAAILHGF